MRCHVCGLGAGGRVLPGTQIFDRLAHCELPHDIIRRLLIRVCRASHRLLKLSASLRRLPTISLPRLKHGRYSPVADAVLQIENRM